MALSCAPVPSKSSPFPPWISSAWKYIEIKCIVNKIIQITTPVVDVEEICKYQYALTCQLPDLKPHLMRYDLNVTYAQKHNKQTCFVTVETSKQKNDLKSLFADICLNNFLKNYSFFKFDLDLGEAVNVTRTVQQRKPEVIRNGNAVLFSNGNELICFASNKEHMHNTLRKIGYTDIQRVETNLYKENLFLLGITIPNLFPNEKVEIESDHRFLNFIWKGKADTTENKLIEKFLQGCSRSTVTFDLSSDVFMLIFDENGDTSKSFTEYIISKCRTLLMNAPKFYLRKENNKVILNTQPVNEQLRIIIEKSICVFTPVAKFSPDLLRFSQRDKCRIWLDTYKNIVVCTDDYRKDVGELCEKCVTGNVCDVLSSGQILMVDFFTKQGYECKRQCMSRFNVDIQVENGVVVLWGNCKKDVSSCKSFIKSLIKEMHTSVKFEGEWLESLNTEFQFLAQDNSCSWRVHTRNESRRDEAREVEWLDPYGALNICIKEGDFDLSTDMFVDLVDDKLCSLLTACSKTDHPLRSVFPKASTILNVNDIYTHKMCGSFSNGRVRYKDIWAVVFAKQIDNESIETMVNSEIRIAFMRMFGFAQQQKYRSIYTNVCLRDGIGNEEEDLVRQMVMAGFSRVRKCLPNDRKNLIIHVGKNKTDAMKAIIDRVYADEFLLQKALPKQMSQASASIRMQVKEGNITKTEACIIVNSSDKKLQFKGGCAREIRAACGTPLEDECRIKYPDGIKTGFVAITGAHELAKHGIRYIFHIALDKYKDNVNMIKDVVISCLKIAVELECSTIAFPALGVGALEYLWRETAFVMFETVDEFAKINPSAKIKEVTFICHAEDKRTCSAFKNEAFRRSKICHHKPVPSMKTTTLFQGLIVKRGDTEIRILKSQGYCAFPSYAVEIRDSIGPTTIKTKDSNTNTLNKIKEARQKPYSWNDILLGPLDPQLLKSTIRMNELHT